MIQTNKYKCYYHLYKLKMQSEDPDFVKPPRDPIYHQKLFNKPTLVLTQSQKSRKQLEDFIYAFQKRIDAQLSYAKNLLAVSKYLDKYILPGTQKSASYVCSAFKVNNQQRAQQATELAQSFKTEIVNIANQMLNQHANKTQKFKRDYKKLSKQLITFEDNLIRTQNNYKSMDKETQQLLIKKNIVKYSNELSQDKKSKHINKTLQTLREKKEYQSIFLQAGKQYNDFIRAFKENVTYMLQQSDKDQQARIRIQADCIRKMIVCEISMFKNVEYDLINISKQMEIIKPQIDIQKFVQQCQDKEIQIKSTLQEKNLDVDNSLLAISLKKIEQQYFTWLLNFKRNKNLRGIITNRWKNLNQSNTNSIISEESELRNSLQQVSEQKMEISKQEKIKQQNKSSENPDDEIKNQEQAKDKKTIEQQPQQKKKRQASGQILTPSKFVLYYSEEELKKFWIEIAEKQKVFDEPYLKGHNESPNNVAKQPEQLFNQFIKMTHIIAYFWKGGYKKDMLKQFQAIISSNQIMRLLCSFFIEQYRTHHIVSVQTKSIKPISKFMNTFLEQARKSDDVFTVRNMIGLIFIFCYEQANNKKNFYQNALVYQASIWKRNDFWDAAIFESIYQQLAVFAVQSSQTHSQTILRQKNMVFSQLASYCHYMIMMGISSKNVRIIVGKYCRLLDMTDDQNKDLSKMITNTYKQFKEMFGAGMIG